MAIRLTRSTAYERAAQRINPKQLVDNIKGDAQVITRDIPKLAQAEIKPAAKAAGIGGGMFGAAGYLALGFQVLLVPALVLFAVAIPPVVSDLRRRGPDGGVAPGAARTL